MQPQPDRIVFATEQPLLIAGLRDLLNCAGLTAELSVVMPGALCGNLKPDEACLVILDGESQHPWQTVALARQTAPSSRFVLLPAEITPQLIHGAIEAGLHGLLATTLPMEEAAQALARIWQGECQFHYVGECTPMGHREGSVNREAASGAGRVRYVDRRTCVKTDEKEAAA